MAVAEGTSHHSQAMTEVRRGHTQSCSCRWHWWITPTSPSPFCTCLGKTLSYQLLKHVCITRCDWLALRGSFCCPLLLLNCRPVTLTQLCCLWSSGQARGGAAGAGFLFPLDGGTFPQRPAWGSFWSSSQFLLQVIGNCGNSGSLNISAKHHAKMDSSSQKDRLGLWCCRTCFWVRVALPPVYMFIHY